MTLRAIFALIIFATVILMQSIITNLVQRHASASSENHRSLQELIKTLETKLEAAHEEIKSHQKSTLEFQEEHKKIAHERRDVSSQDRSPSQGSQPEAGVLGTCMSANEAIQIFLNKQELFVGCKADEDRVLRAFAALSPSGGKVFVDVGANRGYTATSIFSIFANLNYRFVTASHRLSKIVCIGGSTYHRGFMKQSAGCAHQTVRQTAD